MLVNSYLRGGIDAYDAIFSSRDEFLRAVKAFTEWEDYQIKQSDYVQGLASKKY